jgi:hypothetical protein
MAARKSIAMQNKPQPVMPVGTPAAIASSYASQAASQHAAIDASMTYRNAALLELADKFLGELSNDIVSALGIETSARRVLVSAANQRHAIARRQLATQFDADLMATRLTEALANLRFLVTPQRDPRIFVLIGFAQSADKCIGLPLKLVRVATAATKQDEWWVQTAFPLGAGTYRRKLARGELHVLQSGPLPTNFTR